MDSALLSLVGLSSGDSVLNALGITTSSLLGSIKVSYEQCGPVYLGPGSFKVFKPFSLAVLDPYERSALEKAKKFAMEQSIKAAVEKQSLLPLFPTFSNKKAQSLSLLSRIYVGSINYDLKEDAVRKVFVTFGPIKTVNLSWDPDGQKHKGFAFLEFEYPEAAYLSIQQIGNTSLAGRQLKVGRPSNLSNPEPLISEFITEFKLQNRVYVTGVHTDLLEDDLALVFEAFGKISFCKYVLYCKMFIDRLMFDPVKTTQHRGFGYIEFESAQSAIDAIDSMNMFDLGGQYLRVCKAIAPLDHNPNTSLKVTTPATSLSIRVMNELNEITKTVTQPDTSLNGLLKSSPKQATETSNSLNESSWDALEANEANCNGNNNNNNIDDDDDAMPLERQENVFIKGHDARNLMMQKLSRTMRGVMVLRNMVGPDDIDEELENEVRDECNNYGSVEKVVIHQQADEQGEPKIKIFVVFNNEQSLDQAMDALNGRYFAGRQVISEVYDLARFDMNDLTG